MIEESGTGQYLMDTRQVSLPQTPMPGTVQVAVGQSYCERSTVRVSGNLVDWAECTIGASNASVGLVQYSYVEKAGMRFAIDPTFLATPHVIEIWKVYVNGNLVTNYQVVNHAVEFSQPFVNGTEVLVQVQLIRSI
jgi:hypothetical protein